MICYFSLNIAYWVITRDYSSKSTSIKSPRKLWWVFFILFFVSNVICWLVYWPAPVTHDNWWIAKTGLNISHQPIMYNAIISLFVKIGDVFGSITYGIIFYTFLQVLIASIVLSYTMIFIFQCKIPKFLKVFFFLFVFLMPVYARYSITNVKDIYWSLCVTGWSILLYKYVTYPEKCQERSFFIKWVICILGIVLLRNNGSYIMITTLAILWFIIPKARKKICCSILVVFISMGLVSQWMKAINAQQLFQEKAGIPIQQLAATIKYDGELTAEQKEFINNIMPLENLKEMYDPYAIDSIKWSKGIAKGFSPHFLENHQEEFMHYWFEILPYNFAIYVRAWLQTTYWFWTPTQKRIEVFNIKRYNEEHPLYSFMKEKNYLVNQVLSENIRQKLENHYYSYATHFLSEGVLFWLLVACALLYYLKHRNLKKLVVYLPCFLLWLTLMVAASIAQQFRYILPFAYLLPFFIALLFVPKDEISENDNFTLLGYNEWSDKTKHVVQKISKITLCIFLIMWSVFYITSHIPLKARADVYVPYTEEPKILVYLDNQKKLADETSWMPKIGKRGVVVQEDNRKMMFTIIALDDVDIDIALRGPDERDENGKRYEKWVKYTSFKINGKSVMPDSQAVWHDKPYKYVLHAQKNMTYNVQLKWEKK